jgi:hypothetical protein
VRGGRRSCNDAVRGGAGTAWYPWRARLRCAAGSLVFSSRRTGSTRDNTSSTQKREPPKPPKPPPKPSAHRRRQLYSETAAAAAFRRRYSAAFSFCAAFSASRTLLARSLAATLRSYPGNPVPNARAGCAAERLARRPTRRLRRATASTSNTPSPPRGVRRQRRAKGARGVARPLVLGAPACGARRRYASGAVESSIGSAVRCVRVGNSDSCARVRALSCARASCS